MSKKIIRKGKEIVGTIIKNESKPYAIPKSGELIPLTPNEYDKITEQVKKS